MLLAAFRVRSWMCNGCRFCLLRSWSVTCLVIDCIVNQNTPFSTKVFISKMGFAVMCNDFTLTGRALSSLSLIRALLTRTHTTSTFFFFFYIELTLLDDSFLALHFFPSPSGLLFNIHTTTQCSHFCQLGALLKVQRLEVCRVFRSLFLQELCD